MAKKKAVAQTPKQEINIMFVIDVSGSMYGQNLDAVNDAVRNVINAMQGVPGVGKDAVIKLSALEFGDSAHWTTAEPPIASDFVWTDAKPNGGTNLSAACDALDSWLKIEADGGKMSELYSQPPVIILLTDGLPTSIDWEARLAALNGNPWFDAALKYALAIDIDVSEALDVLRKFTGDKETVLKVKSPQAIKDVISVVSEISAAKFVEYAATPDMSKSEEGTDINKITKDKIAEKIAGIGGVSN